jgi:hypothetical protein
MEIKRETRRQRHKSRWIETWNYRNIDSPRSRKKERKKERKYDFYGL